MGRPAVRFIDTNSPMLRLNMHRTMPCFSSNLLQIDGIKHQILKSNLFVKVVQLVRMMCGTETLNRPATENNALEIELE